MAHLQSSWSLHILGLHNPASHPGQVSPPSEEIHGLLHGSQECTQICGRVQPAAPCPSWNWLSTNQVAALYIKPARRMCNAPRDSKVKIPGRCIPAVLLVKLGSLANSQCPDADHRTLSASSHLDLRACMQSVDGQDFVPQTHSLEYRSPCHRHVEQSIRAPDTHPSLRSIALCIYTQK